MTSTINNFAIIAITILMAISFQSCEKEAMIMTADKEYPGVDAELWMYFQRFEMAAAERGVEIDLIARGITGSIEDIDMDNVVGICNHNPNSPNHVTIDETFWMRSSSLRKEMIIFHELGHCYMNLGHRDEANSNGVCKSIMRSGMGGCMDMYTQNSRGGYHDELFEGK